VVLVDGVSHPDVAKVATFETFETQDISDKVMRRFVDHCLIGVEDRHLNPLCHR